MHGNGTFTFPDNSTYAGAYEEGQRHGRGIYTYSDGEAFERTFVKGVPTEPILRPGTCTGNCEDGRGVYVFESGGRYDGEWAGGDKHGQGNYTFAHNRASYSGGWRAGKKHGHGTYCYDPDCRERYTGAWRNGKQDGHGVFDFAGGGSYEGDFEGGLEHGRGTFTAPTGEIFERKWVRGKPTEPIMPGGGRMPGADARADAGGKQGQDQSDQDNKDELRRLRRRRLVKSNENDLLRSAQRA
eukprot:g4757.t1